MIDKGKGIYRLKYPIFEYRLKGFKMIIKEVEERERIKVLVKDKFQKQREKRQILRHSKSQNRLPLSDLDKLEEVILFYIDNPNYISNPRDPIQKVSPQTPLPKVTSIS